MAVKSFQLEFQSAGTKYIADIWHHKQLSDEEKLKYQIREYSFLVHLFSLQGFRSFEVFIDEDSMQWVTNAEELVDPQLVLMLGDKIDDRFGHC
jgi:hypothetical protein